MINEFVKLALAIEKKMDSNANTEELEETALADIQAKVMIATYTSKGLTAYWHMTHDDGYTEQYVAYFDEETENKIVVLDEEKADNFVEEKHIELV